MHVSFAKLDHGEDLRYNGCAVTPQTAVTRLTSPGTGEMRNSEGMKWAL